MRQVVSIFWDRVNGTHLILMCNVSDSGQECDPIYTRIASNAGTTLDHILDFWRKGLGSESVVAYQIQEYFGARVGRY
jgi:hypothetical protein